MPRLFGTDGVRGVAGIDLTPDLVLALGHAAGRVLAPRGGTMVVGRDTRLSGPMLEDALVAGLCSAGADVLLAGIIPTPGVAHLTLERKAKAGAVISASHNPVEDNGIKFFSDEGSKTSGDVEDAIEAAMAESPEDLPEGMRVGRAQDLVDGHDRYVSHLLESITDSLDGLTIVLDCAFGAAWSVGPRVFAEAGAAVVPLHAEADGARINVDCGSTSLGRLAEVVVDKGADFGLGFDGDADRVLGVDHTGGIVDGDRILALAAVRLQKEGRLTNGLVVATVMANLGFRRYLEGLGIDVVTAPVGDKFVAEAMSEHGATLGGEQSGHVIFAEHSTTGDGLLTGLKIGEAVASSDKTLAELAHAFEPWPQVLINVPVASTDGLKHAREVWDAVAATEATLGDEGRVLVRASGTEPLVRVMVEAAEADGAEAAAHALADVVRAHLGG